MSFDLAAQLEKQSTELSMFYRLYYEFLTKPDPRVVFKTYQGLCNSLLNLGDLGWDGLDRTERKIAYRELDNQFAEAGMDTVYPFNGNGITYQEEVETNSVPLNPSRIAWVLLHLKD